MSAMHLQYVHSRESAGLEESDQASEVEQRPHNRNHRGKIKGSSCESIYALFIVMNLIGSAGHSQGSIQCGKYACGSPAPC